MTAQSIISQDLSLAEVFQAFYRVPDYQREYVWGEPDAKGERGDEVEQFLRDIHSEFELATGQDAPEYFIGTIVVCPGGDGVFDLIDGQQRTTTAFLVLCAIRDVLTAAGASVPDTLKAQIFSSSVDWQGESTDRLRLDLQYDDAKDALEIYGHGTAAPGSVGTRSIRNLANAYDAVSEFLTTTFPDDANGVQRFYGYFINKVKLIRIQTPSVSRALKIFETINDRGVGLDAMDLLKNLLFMSAKPADFVKLKDIWKQVTQSIYAAREKPLRFLRYFLMASYDVDAKLREEEIYNWLGQNVHQTGHTGDPIGFVKHLNEAAAAYRNFVEGKAPAGRIEHGIVNTRSLGGGAIKQHFVLLLAGRHLPPVLFSRLACGLEEMMFVWLIAGVPAKEYERSIALAARTLRGVTDIRAFDPFEQSVFVAEKRKRKTAFHDKLSEMYSWDLRKFRLKYLFAKITQHVDVDAYGPEGRAGPGPYLDTANDIEHILSRNANSDAQAEFGDDAGDEEWIESLGNLLWLERSINRAIGNAAYSEKTEAYPTSQFLFARCQAVLLKVGVNDQITRAMKRLDPAAQWTTDAIEQRQTWLADRALEVWGVPA
ncbi:DUF262 domain-containing protein [Sphingomonas sp.]|uniref:DUF262 domain-containing protein n=1 Tax=Sphingomonas sp. TaxID=28214 RepID=UPI0035BC400D